MAVFKNRLHRNPKTLTRIIDSNAVVIFLCDDCDEDLKREVYIFNDTGTAIWELINGKNTAGEIANKISCEYELTSQEADECVDEFVDKLFEGKLINSLAFAKQGEKK